MCIPVVYQFTKFSCEDALLGLISLEVISRPAIYDVVMFCNTSGMYVSCSYWTIGIGVFVLCNL